MFESLHHLPDPTLGSDGHYKPFEELFGRSTSGDGRPSLNKSRDIRKGPFVPSIQHARNTYLMIQCEECLKWRIVYSRHKLTVKQRAVLEKKCEDFSFSCGCDLADLEEVYRAANSVCT